MKKITYLLFFIFISITINAQTISWFSDAEDVTGFGVNDVDGDGFNWSRFSGGGEDLGFTSGAIFYSESWSSDPAPNGTPLTPDNQLFTPTFLINNEANVINYKMKVAAIDANFFSEKFAVYVYDDNSTDPAVLIHEETLTSGGDGTAKDIMAEIPSSYAGKTIGIIIRHYDTTDENTLLIDDLEVSYSTTLSTSQNNIEKISVYPNSIKDFVKIRTSKTIDNISIVNQLGQQVITFNKNEITNNTVNLISLSKGIYFMVVKTENISQSIRIIKE